MTVIIRQADREYEFPMLLSSRSPKRDQMRVLCDLHVEMSDQRWVFIPTGFLTDFHSVPPVAWSIWHPFDTKTNLGAVVHDWLYEHWEEHANYYDELLVLDDEDARHYSDDMFLAVMNQMSPETHARNRLYYTAVRMAGGKRWAGFRARNASR